MLTLVAPSGHIENDMVEGNMHIPHKVHTERNAKRKGVTATVAQRLKIPAGLK